MYRQIPNLLTLLRLLSAPAVAIIITISTQPLLVFGGLNHLYFCLSDGLA